MKIFSKTLFMTLISGSFCLWSDASEAVSFAEALEKGKVSINARLRFEHVDLSSMAKDANALTLRTRLGFTTAAYAGFQVHLEAENTTAVIDDYTPETAGRPAVLDPEVTEVNQAWIAYSYNKTTGTLGRQRIVLDNARFVGDVAWRQDNQTFDAFRIQDSSIENLTLNYTYLWHINRVVGETADWDSDSHLLNASYSGLPIGTLTGYAYLLDFDNDFAAGSTETYGIRFVGSQPVSDAVKLMYALEYATQSDRAENPADYRADYFLAEVGAGLDRFSLALGYELLGEDNGQGFRTPLGTVHGFNGWSDFALPLNNTFPQGFPAGLRDYYLKGTAKISDDLNLLAFYHILDADTGGADYGTEFDVQAVYRINKYFSVLAKAAFFDGKGAIADVNKYWLQVDFAY